MKQLKKIARWLFPTENDLVQEYLSDSKTLEEIERKQRQLMRGDAPFQTSAKLMSRIGY